ncbi:2036_t:CDS:2 [Scutellospora calospora]|uniref:2036_t:CDS:1 n=1 Tax=Scutellospora calospora TaxID=85575 RepID=A0ACA9KG82_9GLOM|nr:2036_t:CDS:2 [Scutellospora calospora]
MKFCYFSPPYNQDCGYSFSLPQTIVGYYPAYKNNTKPDFNISLITRLNYIAFGPTDLINGTLPSQVFQNKFSNFSQLRPYFNNLELILSVLLPVDNDNLSKLPPFANFSSGQQYNSSDNQTQQFINDLVSIVNDYQFHGIDIYYPDTSSSSCSQATSPINLNPVFTNFLIDLSNKLKPSKNLTITVGRIPTFGWKPNLNPYVDFVNIQFNLGTAHDNYDIPTYDLQTILNDWSGTNIDKKKFIFVIEFGGIIEIITSISNNITMDILNHNFANLNRNITTFPISYETITDPCNASYAYLSWEAISTNFLSSPCYTSINDSSQQQQWTYSFNNITKQSFIYKPVPPNVIQNPISNNKSSSKPHNSPSNPNNSGNLQKSRRQNNQQFYYISYEDFRSLSAKLNFVQNNNMTGIAISDITKNSQFFANFILGSKNPGPENPIPISQSNHIGTIVGSIIGAFVFVSVLVTSGFILYRRKHSAGNVITTVVALFDYVGKEENDLSFKAGDIIEVLEKGDGPNDWWVGKLHGIIGEFPEAQATYLVLRSNEYETIVVITLDVFMYYSFSYSNFASGKQGSILWFKDIK